MEPRQLLAADVLLGAIALGGPVEAQPEVIEEGVGSIAGQVTMSADNSGLEGVVLHLLGEVGEFLDKTQTNTEGDYRFGDLSPGIYAVLEIQPSGIIDDGALVGSGGGVAFDNNLLGEIVVYPGSDLVGYNFRELAVDELSEAGAEEPPPLVRHSAGEPTQLAEAALWQLYGSSPIALAGMTAPLESPSIFVSAANYQPLLPATRILATPFYGSFNHADTESTVGEENGDSSETPDGFRDGPWQLDFDSWFAATDRVVRDTNEVPFQGDWNDDDDTEDLGIFREDLWILDYQGDQELDTKDYDRVFELSEAEDQQVRLELEGFTTL